MGARSGRESMEVTQMFRKMLRAALVAVGGIALGAAVMPSQAQADWLDDLFGGGSGGGGYSGRETVRFSPRFDAGQIIVSFGDRRLYYVIGKGTALSYPIAIPKGDARWAGTSIVSQKRVNPSWTPTAEMRAENPKLPAFVPGGHPRNPLGVRALYLGASLYRIHGTDAPWLIGQEVSKGCIRMTNEDVIDLYNRARVGARVTVTWSRFSSS
jgi:lipoprotein-anchoring transpeptidase ErfK/SrfK